MGKQNFCKDCHHRGQCNKLCDKLERHLQATIGELYEYPVEGRTHNGGPVTLVFRPMVWRRVDDALREAYGITDESVQKAQAVARHQAEQEDWEVAVYESGSRDLNPEASEQLIEDIASEIQEAHLDSHLTYKTPNLWRMAPPGPEVFPSWESYASPLLSDKENKIRFYRNILKLTFAEIAQRVRIPAGTCKKSYHKCEERVRLGLAGIWSKRLDRRPFLKKAKTPKTLAAVGF